MPKFLDVTDTAAARARLGISENAISVMGYEAVGDGIADDTLAIHAARDAAGVGGAVFFPAGTYLVDGLTASVSSQTWELADGAVVKMKTAAAKTLLITADNVTIIGGTFDAGNGTAHDSTQHCIQIGTSSAGVDGVSIKGVTVLDSPWYGIAAYSPNQLVISGCTVLNTWATGIWVQNYSDPVTDISITDNLVDVSTGTNETTGIGITGTLDANSLSRVTVSRNKVVLIDGGTEESSGIYINTTSDYTVSDNVISGGWAGMSCPRSTRAVFSGNVMRGFYAIGLELPIGASDVAVMGNIFDPGGNAAYSGIQTSAGTQSGLSIAGNTIRNFTAGNSVGIRFGSGSTPSQVTITGNSISGAASGFDFKGILFSAPIENLVVTGNVIDAEGSTTSSGIEFGNAVAGAAITGNHFSNITTAAVRFGTGSAVSQDYIRIAGNSYVSCAATVNNNYGGGASALGNNLSTETLQITSQLKDTNGKTSVALTATTNAVNYLRIINASSGGSVVLNPDGSDATVDLNLGPRGTAGWVKMITSAGATVARFGGITSPVNYFTIAPSVSGSALLLAAAGSDANVSIDITPKGSGTVRVAGNPVGVKVAVPASATATGTPGQWAANASWFYVCTAANTWVRAALASW